jgi:hypothetical protein
MQGAFVVKLKSARESGQDDLSGSVEEVDTGEEVKFRTSEELLGFLRRWVSKEQKDQYQVGRAG